MTDQDAVELARRILADDLYCISDRGYEDICTLARAVLDARDEVERLRGKLRCGDEALTDGAVSGCTVCGEEDNKHCSACTARMHLEHAHGGEVDGE